MPKPVLWFQRPPATGFWYYRLAGEKTFHSTGLRDRATAEAAVFAQPGRRLRDARAGRSPTLQEFCTDFFIWGRCAWIRKQHAQGHTFEEGTAAARRSYLTRHILPEWGKVELPELRKPAIMRWLMDLELSNQTKNHILYTLRIITREAADEELISVDPLAVVQRFGDAYKARDAFSAAELRALFPAAPAALAKIWGKPPSAILFMLMAGAGLRSGEARAVRWRSILWRERALLVEETVKGQGKQMKVGAIASKKGGARIELLPSRILSALLLWRKAALFDEPGDLVFPGDDRNLPLSRKTLGRRLSVAVRRVNAAAKKAGRCEPITVESRNLVVHSLRHTYVTRMRSLAPRGIPLGGHHSDLVTERYDHRSQVERIKEREPMRPALEALWGEPGGTGDVAEPAVRSGRGGHRGPKASS